MSDFNWSIDQEIRNAAVADALTNNDVFITLLEDLSSGMQMELCGQSIDAIRRGDAHIAITTASEAKGIEDFLHRLKRLGKDSGTSKTSRDR